MTVSELRKILHEEVVKAIREELREILTEAVQVSEDMSFKNPLQELRENVDSEESTSISRLLQETASSMGREDYRNLIERSPEPKMTGMPDFIVSAASKAKAILDASNLKDREKHGI